VHAWDEGVAFYTGTLEGTTSGGNSAGKLVYRLAEKRCANFGTCSTTGTETSGTAKVNLDLFPLFAEGARKLERGECSAVRPIVDQIVSLMTVPLVQGTLRYAYKVGMVAADRSQKNAAEGAVFAASVLPLVHHCNPSSASTISANMKFGLFDAGTYPDFAAVKSAIEDTYSCMGITCAQVGALQNSDGTLKNAATAACVYSGATYQFSVTVEATLESITEADKTAMKASIASQLNVDVAQVSVVLAAASVTVTVSIKAASTAQTAALTLALGSALTDTATAKTLLGGSFTVTTIVSTGVASPPPAPPVSNVTDWGNGTAPAPPPSFPITVVYETNDDMPAWGIAVLVILAVTAVGVCALVMFMRAKEKAGKPMFTTLVKPT
jgi:hypothetical protein